MQSNEFYFKMAESKFLFKLNLIKWEAAQWMQYAGNDYDSKNDKIILHFKTSSYDISFDIEINGFNRTDYDIYLPFNEMYNLFRDSKYNNYKK